jgi:hypothetical protein
MNFQWLNQGAPCPIVEFHDIRTEKFRADKYLDLVEGHLTGPLLEAGITPIGQFRVWNHPERLLLLRGYPSMPARRRALAAFHAGSGWSAHRAEAVGFVRSAEVSLTRAVVPADGIRALRQGEPMLALLSELRFAEQIGDYHLWLRLFLRKAGLDPLAAFATLEAVNDVPAVPIVRNRIQHIALLRRGEVPQLPAELRAMLRYAPQSLTLEPTAELVW